MTAHEHHPQPVVGDFLLRKNHFIRRGNVAFHHADDFRFLLAKIFLPPHHVERPVARRLHEPGWRILGHAVERPRLQCPRQRLLHHVLGQLKMLDSKNAGQRGDHFRRFMAEKMFDRMGDFLRFRGGLNCVLVWQTCEKSRNGGIKSRRHLRLDVERA